MARYQNTLDTPHATVVARYQLDGSSEALTSLMNRFTPTMSAVARRYLRCTQDVEDAVQDAWVAFTRASATIENPGAVAGWLCTTTGRCALAIAQRQSRCRPAGDRRLETKVAPLDASGIEMADETAAVRAAVARLDDNEREMVRFLFVSELSYVEIAERTGRSVGGIGPTRQRIITKLRRDRDVWRQMAARSA